MALVSARRLLTYTKTMLLSDLSFADRTPAQRAMDGLERMSWFEGCEWLRGADTAAFKVWFPEWWYTAKDLLRQGDPEGALALIKGHVPNRHHPGDEWPKGWRRWSDVLC